MWPPKGFESILWFAKLLHQLPKQHLDACTESLIININIQNILFIGAGAFTQLTDADTETEFETIQTWRKNQLWWLFGRVWTCTYFICYWVWEMNRQEIMVVVTMKIHAITMVGTRRLKMSEDCHIFCHFSVLSTKCGISVDFIPLCDRFVSTPIFRHCYDRTEHRTKRQNTHNIR